MTNITKLLAEKILNTTPSTNANKYIQLQQGFESITNILEDKQIPPPRVQLRSPPQLQIHSPTHMWPVPRVKLKNLSNFQEKSQ